MKTYNVITKTTSKLPDAQKGLVNNGCISGHYWITPFSTLEEAEREKRFLDPIVSMASFVYIEEVNE